MMESLPTPAFQASVHGVAMAVRFSSRRVLAKSKYHLT